MKKQLCFRDRLIRTLRTEFVPLLGFMLTVLALLSAGCRHVEVEGRYSSLNAPAIQKSAPVNTSMVSRKIEPAWLKPSPDLFTLGPGDRLEIEVLGDPASRAITVVAPDGKLYFNFLEGLDVWGATIAQ